MENDEFEKLFNDEFKFVVAAATYALYKAAIKKCKLPANFIDQNVSEEDLAIALWELERGFLRQVPGTD